MICKAVLRAPLLLLLFGYEIGSRNTADRRLIRVRRIEVGLFCLLHRLKVNRLECNTRRD